jgi:hypothetical protein
MVFTERQIQEVLEIIDFQHTLFVAGNIGLDILNETDKSILRKYGIDWTILRQDFTPYQQLFYFGRLASVLGPLNTQKVNYTDLNKYLQRGQFVPLSAAEKSTLKYLEKKSYEYIRGLGQTVRSFVSGKLEDENIATRRYWEETLKDSLERTVVERDSVRNIVSELGHKTQDWTRDLGRIAQTELQNAYEYGKGAAFNDIYGDEKVYYKQVYPGACRFCVKLYLTAGIGSVPKLFTYQELLDNGTNIGRKQDEWKAVLGTVHPFCRCDLRIKRNKSDVWNEEKGIFEPKEVDSKSRGTIKIQVGDKHFEV